MLRNAKRGSDEYLALKKAEAAIERARNIGAALADGVEDPERVILEMLLRCTADLTLGARALAVVDTRDAWLRAVGQ